VNNVLFKILATPIGSRWPHRRTRPDQPSCLPPAPSQLGPRPTPTGIATRPLNAKMRSKHPDTGGMGQAFAKLLRTHGVEADLAVWHLNEPSID
jgi:hypothetical protein